MPLLHQIQIDSDSVLGIWQIDEEKDQLKWELQWGPSDIEQFQALSDHERSMHWLSSRVLLRKMMNTKSFIDLQIDENGKPYIKNFPQKVSISHSGKRVAVLLSNRDCGIDIELMSKKITALAPKFISDDEMKYIDDDYLIETMYVFWCAKEAMYKLYGRKKLDFKQHMRLYPFEYKDTGKIKGHLERKEYSKDLNVHYKRIDDYMLAYVLDSKKELK